MYSQMFVHNCRQEFRRFDYNVYNDVFHLITKIILQIVKETIRVVVFPTSSKVFRPRFELRTLELAVNVLPTELFWTNPLKIFPSKNLLAVTCGLIY